MKTKSIVCLAVVASMGLSSVSFAQDRDRDHHGPAARAERHEIRHDRRELRHDRGELRKDRREERHDEYAYGARGPEWHRGAHIPRTYRDREYVVSHWEEHHLRRPPRGYEWVQVGGDYVLVAIASGIIAEILLNH